MAGVTGDGNSECVFNAGATCAGVLKDGGEVISMRTAGCGSEDASLRNGSLALGRILGLSSDGEDGDATPTSDGGFARSGVCDASESECEFSRLIVVRLLVLMRSETMTVTMAGSLRS